MRGPQHRDRAAERHLPADAGARRRAAVRRPCPPRCPPRRRRLSRQRRRASRSPPPACWSRSAPGPACPRCPGIELAITSDQILEDVYPLPERLAVVGAGYIGLELASIFNAPGRAHHPDPARRPALARLRAGPAPAPHRRGRGPRRALCGTRPVVERIERAAGGLQLRHQPRPARGRRGHLRHRPLARAADRAASAWRRTACALQPDRHGRGRRPPTAAAIPASSPSATAATMPAPRWTACRSTSRRSPSPRAGRVAESQFNANACDGQLRHHPDRRLRPAPGGLGRPVRGQGARPGPRGHRSTAPASGRCSTR